MQVSQLHMQIRICVRIVGSVITHIATDADLKANVEYYIIKRQTGCDSLPRTVMYQHK